MKACILLRAAIAHTLLCTAAGCIDTSVCASLVTLIPASPEEVVRSETLLPRRGQHQRRPPLSQRPLSERQHPQPSAHLCSSTTNKAKACTALPCQASPTAGACKAQGSRETHLLVCSAHCASQMPATGLTPTHHRTRLCPARCACSNSTASRAGRTCSAGESAAPRWRRRRGPLRAAGQSCAIGLRRPTGHATHARVLLGSKDGAGCSFECL